MPTIPFVQAVQKRLPADLERSFHKGATTQDIIDTALVLRVRDGLDQIARDLCAIMTGLSRIADEHRSTPCVGRTYSQHAAPLSFGYKAAVWLTGIADVTDRLPDLRRACWLPRSAARLERWPRWARTARVCWTGLRGTSFGHHAAMLAHESRPHGRGRGMAGAADRGAGEDGDRCCPSRFDGSRRGRRNRICPAGAVPRPCRTSATRLAQR